MDSVKRIKMEDQTATTDTHPNDQENRSKKMVLKFIDENKLKNHTSSIHRSGDPNFECEICFKKFFASGNLQIHYKDVHSETRRYKCNVCAAGFKRKSELHSHLIAKHSDVPEACKDIKSHECELCSKAFYSVNKLERHVILVHVVDKPFKCQICHKTFMDEKESAKHELSHKKEKSYFACDVCAQHFTAKKGLYRHLAVQHNKFFYCRKCSTSFTNKTDFDQHFQTVSEEESEKTNKSILQCVSCQLCFNSQCSFTIHTETHFKEIKIKRIMEEKQEQKQVELNAQAQAQSSDELQCDLCSKIFDCVWDLIVHKKYTHPNSKWQCQVCLKTFKQRYMLKNHENSVHATATEKLYNCDICQSNFKCPSSLRIHKQIHLAKKDSINQKNSNKSSKYLDCTKIFTCSVCPYKTSDDKNVAIHYSQHGLPKVNLSNSMLCKKEKKSSSFDVSSGDFSSSSSTLTLDLDLDASLGLKSLNYHDSVTCTTDDERRHKCRYCSKLYASPQSLKEHLFVHADGKLTMCHHCLVQFSTRGNLKRHLKQFH